MIEMKEQSKYIARYSTIYKEKVVYNKMCKKTKFILIWNSISLVI